MQLLLPTLSYKHTVRLYDVNTLQCYVSPDARDQHRAAITSVSKCSHDISECLHSIFMMFSHDSRLYLNSV